MVGFSSQQGLGEKQRQRKWGEMKETEDCWREEFGRIEGVGGG